MFNPMSLQDRTILVTGAGQGIGRAVSLLALELGANVVAVDRNKEGVDAIAAGRGDGRVLALGGDVTVPEIVLRMVEESVARFGAVHGLVNNAGVTRPAMIKKMTLEQWDEVIKVNQTAAFLCLQAVGVQMLKQAAAGVRSPGAIVNVSSNAGRRGSIGQINYSATKSALLGMTMSATQEWSPQGIRINSVCFGVIETPMTETIRGDRFREGIVAKIPMGRWATVEEAAKPVCFLLSEAASFITGQHLSIDGGAFLAA
jgi:3-oxoacyl-[acyl-carrier protein] reductase